MTVYLREDPKHPSWVTRAVTVREPEFSLRDQAQLLDSFVAEREPRGPHGIPLSEATDPAYNPYSPDAKGRFVAEPVVDYAQSAIDKAREDRRKSLQNPDDDWAIFYTVRREDRVTPSET